MVIDDAPGGRLASAAARGPFRPRLIRRGLCLPILAAPLLTLGACSLFGDDGPLRVVAIGTLHRNPDRVSAPLSLPDQLLVESVGQGLVSVSANGRIEPGLAERWTVIDDGRSYIFRLRDARWPDGQSVRAGEIAAAMRGRIASSRLRPLMRGEFQSVRQIRAMTSRVIEIQLGQPRPDLLELLSQPDMSFSRNGQGWGPMRASWAGGTVTLRERTRPRAGEAEADDAPPAILLWNSGTAVAVAQFGAGEADAVLGGSFGGWPMLDAADVADQAVVMDPTEGLFGLSVVGTTGVLADVATRNAIAMAFDRTRMIGVLQLPGWTPRITLRAEPSGGAAAISPVYPAWADMSVADRQAQARATIGSWRQRNGGGRPTLRIAMPAGPGGRMLFARMRTDLGRVGIRARLVASAADADLRLVDEVAPSRDAAWYVRRLNCGRGISCSDDTRRLVEAIDAQTTPTDRANAITAAEDAIIRHMGFIPIAAPVRWSLRNDRVPGLLANARSLHGLYRLRTTPN